MNEAWSIEITPPALARHRQGTTGIDYVTTLDSGRPGPHLMLSALVHGNELCGAVVLDELLRQPQSPPRGRLTLAFMNVAAYARFEPRAPLAARYVDEDFNRLWQADVLDGPRDSVELARARALRPLIDQVDYLLDLHSMQTAAPALVLCGPSSKGRALARALGYPALIVSDRGHAGGTRLRDYGAFNDPASPRNALLVECGQHWARTSITVAREMVRRFLAHFAMLPAAWAADWQSAPPVAQQLITVTQAVTASSDDFRFVGQYHGMEIIPKAGTLIAHDGPREIRTPYDNCALVMPITRLRPGQTAVRLGRLESG